MAFGDAKEGALGELMGQIQQIIDNSSREAGKYDPIHNIWTYFTPQMGLGQLQSLLEGSQSRALGSAGRLATATANATGMNPYAAQQHAQSPIYGQYADAFSKLPLQVGQFNLGANQGNFENLYRLLALKGGLAGERSSGIGGGLIGGLGSIAGAYAGRG